MAFKMKGSPAKLGTIQGTAGHRSALKVRGVMSGTKKVVKGMQDAGKKTAAAGSYAKAKQRDPNLAEYIKKRKTLEKGSPEWNANQNKINAAYGVKKRYPVDTPKTETKVEKPKSEVKKEKIQAKADKKIAEVDENVDKKSAKQARKAAKKEFGKDSKEFLTAKKKELEAKEADRQGAKGGKKQNIFRRISSKINKKRQEKIDKKLAEKTSEDSPANKNYNK